MIALSTVEDIIKDDLREYERIEAEIKRYISLMYDESATKEVRRAAELALDALSAKREYLWRSIGLTVTMKIMKLRTSITPLADQHFNDAATNTDSTK